MTKDQPRDEDTGKFGGYDDSLFIRAVELVGSGTTSDIHERVCELASDDGPTWRTTHDRLKKLADRNEIRKEEVGGSFKWHVSGESRIELVYETVEEYGPAKAEVLAKMADMDPDEFEEMLNELEDEDRVTYELIGEKIVWQIPP